MLKKEPREWLIAFVTAVLLYSIGNAFLFTQYVVSRESRSPMFHDGDCLIVSKIAKSMN